MPMDSHPNKTDQQTTSKTPREQSNDENALKRVLAGRSTAGAASTAFAGEQVKVGPVLAHSHRTRRLYRRAASATGRERERR